MLTYIVVFFSALSLYLFHLVLTKWTEFRTKKEADKLIEETNDRYKLMRIFSRNFKI